MKLHSNLETYLTLNMKMENCRKTSNNKVFTFKENRSSLTLLNKDEVPSMTILVDGCEIKGDQIRCDYMHIAKETEIYIELKGQDLTHAMDQIEKTMGLLSTDKKKQKKISYIICTRSPLSSTEIQIFGRKFKERFNSKLVIKSSPFTDSY